MATTMTASSSSPSPSTAWILDGPVSNVEDSVSCGDGETGPSRCYIDELNRCQDKDFADSCNDHSAKNQLTSMGAFGVTDSSSGCYKYEQERTTMPDRANSSSSSNTIACILCMECMEGRELLQQHLLEVHKVKAETLNGIMRLVDTAEDRKVPVPLANSSRSERLRSTLSDIKDVSSENDDDDDDCSKSGGAVHKSPSHASLSSKFQERASENGMETENNEDHVIAEVPFSDNKMFHLLEEEEEETSCDDVAGALPDKEEEEEEEEDVCRCQTCSKSFLTIDVLYSHQNELGHLELKQMSTGPGYLCWYKRCKQYFKTADAVQVHHRQAHVLRSREMTTTAEQEEEVGHRCHQCNLSFKTIDRLQIHSYYHMIRSATDCIICGMSFKTTIEVRKHMDACHVDAMSKEQMARFQANVAAASSLALLGASGLDARPSETSFAVGRHQNQGTSLSKKFPKSSVVVSSKDSRTSKNYEERKGEREERTIALKLDENSNASLVDGMEDGGGRGGSAMMKFRQHQQLDSADEYFQNNTDNYTVNKYKCHRCKVGFPKMSYLSAHNKTLQHRQGSKLTADPLEKYFDPNRPHKCDVCAESFTQKNILLIHYNSVSHMHRVKQQQQQQDPHLVPSSMLGDDRNGRDGSPNKDDVLVENVEMEDDDHPKSNAGAGAPLPKFSVITSVGKTMVPSTTSCPASSSADGELPSNPVVSVTRDSVVTSNVSFSASDVSSKVANDVTNKTYSCTLCSVSYSDRTSYEAHLCSILHAKRSTRVAAEMSHLFQTSCAAPWLMSMSSLKANDHFAKCSAASFQQLRALHLPSFQSATSILTSSSAAFQQPLTVFQGTQSANSTVGGGVHHLPPLTSARSFANGVSGQLATMGQQTLRSSSDAQLNDDNNEIRTNSDSSLRSQNHHHSNDDKMHASACSCHKCGTVFNAFEFLAQHQCATAATHVRAGPSSTRVDGGQAVGRPSCQMQRTLLKSYGFECVMQFNEYRQKAKKKEATNEKSAENASDANHVSPDENDLSSVEKIEDEKNKESGTNARPNVHLPELVKCLCCKCSKEFSSIWVMRAHEEEVHKELLPTELIDEFGKGLRKLYDARHASQETTRVVIETSTPTTTAQVGKRHERVVMTSDAALKLSEEMRNGGAQRMQLPLMMGMNLLPPMPMMMSLGAEFFGLPPFSLVDPSMMMMSRQQNQKAASAYSMAAAAAAAAAAAQQSANNQHQQQKSARTRITDEQLIILRAHFDINNSPSEEQIRDMSEKTTLLPKVIKHWFRNTLFKERQRNKDSPYNFSIPPSTVFNLEEYERLTQSLMKKEGPSQESKEDQISSAPPPLLLTLQETQNQNTVRVKSEVGRTSFEMQSEHDVTRSSTATTNATPVVVLNSPNIQGGTRMTFQPSLLDSTGDMSAAMLSNFVQMSPLYLPSPISQQGITTPNNIARLSLSQVPFFSGLSESSLQERRANRTRFSKNQVNVLQEFFEQNAYPKDDELENLSKLLDLNPRVIIVWFQNARQKVRKNFENQPAIDMSDEGGAGGGTTVQMPTESTYKCKKCLAPFLHYDELVRHKRSVCFKDEENYHVSISDSHVSYDVTDDDDDDSRSHSSAENESMSASLALGGTGPGIEYCCEKCNLVFYSLEKWKEHQSIHAASLGLAVPQGSFSSSSAASSLGVTKNRDYDRDRMELDVGCGGGRYSNNAAVLTNDESSAMKQWSDDGDDRGDQPRDKRIRTTILPEQLDYLYSKYQLDCNPSRKQLDAIATRVGLKKRVVQVWFQNTRARERKGQYRAHQQLIHKRCPFCKALFRAKTALEAHLTLKHPEEMTAGREINVDSLPDEPIETECDSPIHVSTPSGPSNLMKSASISNAYAMTNPFVPVIPPMVRSLNAANLLRANMQRLYEDSFKKYIDELSHVSHQTKAEAASSSAVRGPETSSGISTTTTTRQDDSPLDLSMSIRSSVSDRRSYDESATTLGVNHVTTVQDDSRSGSRSEDDNDEYSFVGGDSSPLSPSSSTSNQSKQMFGMPGKRYRTQISSIQIKVMKSIFVNYKTPTMSECDALGHEIALPKRVVQVWFQNARAKEKKCTIESPGASPVSASLPSLPSLTSNYCALCDLSYSLQNTVQDHLFTKKHIDKIKSNLRSKKEATSVNRRLSADVPRRSKFIEDASESKTKNNRMLAESLSSHYGLMLSGPQSSSSSSAPVISAFQSQAVDKRHRTKSDVTSAGHKVKIEQGEPVKTSMAATLGRQGQGLSPAVSTASHLFSPFGRFPALPVPNPADIMSMMPYLYPCLTGFYPGSGMPFMPTAPMMQGLENMFMCDPVNFGTPLKLLQIPAACIKKIEEKLQDKDCAVTFYSQDCRSFSDLKRNVSHDDWTAARKATIDVGFICRKCHIVYPGRAACISHQQTTCYQGFQNSTTTTGAETVLKLEQLQYDCSACGVRCSTIAEYKAHCAQDLHKQAVGSSKGQGQCQGNSNSKKSVSLSSIPTIMPPAEGQVRLESSLAAAAGAGGGSGAAADEEGNGVIKMEHN